MQSNLEENAPIPSSTRVYFQERLRQRLYDMVMNEFDVYKSKGKTKAHLAMRLGRRPEQITRWLSEPGNLTFDTLSDLLLGLSAAELSLSLTYLLEQSKEPPRIPKALLEIERDSTPLLSYAVASKNPQLFSEIGMVVAISFALQPNAPQPNKIEYVEIM